MAFILLLRAPRERGPTAPRVFETSQETTLPSAQQSSVVVERARGERPEPRRSRATRRAASRRRVPSRDDAVPSAGTRSIRIHPATCARAVARRAPARRPRAFLLLWRGVARRRRRRRHGFGRDRTGWIAPRATSSAIRPPCAATLRGGSRGGSPRRAVPRFGRFRGRDLRPLSRRSTPTASTKPRPPLETRPVLPDAAARSNPRAGPSVARPERHRLHPRAARRPRGATREAIQRPASGRPDVDGESTFLEATKMEMQREPEAARDLMIPTRRCSRGTRAVCSSARGRPSSIRVHKSCGWYPRQGALADRDDCGPDPHAKASSSPSGRCSQKTRRRRRRTFFQRPSKDVLPEDVIPTTSFQRRSYG